MLTDFDTDTVQLIAKLQQGECPKTLLLHQHGQLYKYIIGCLHDPANVQQTSSKCIQNTRESQDVCWTFAGSCKHYFKISYAPISSFQ